MRLLAMLANASLLTAVADRPGRFRYHGRVRDYALSKLPLLPYQEVEVRRRLLTCWTDWEMVRAEFMSVGAHGLAGQFMQLRDWGVDEPADFSAWFYFARGQAPVLGLFPELFFQQASNEPVDSPVSRAARGRVGTPDEPVRWLEWVNRPQQWVPPACLLVLLGHWGGVWGVAVAADGRTAVSGSSDKTVRVWDLTAGRCTAVLEGHAGEVRSVAVAADGRTAVSGSSDKTVRVWDLTAGGPPSVRGGHSDRVSAVAVTADDRAVSVSEDRTVRVWELSTGRSIAVYGEGSDEARREWVEAQHDGPVDIKMDFALLTLLLKDTGEVIARFPGAFSTASITRDGRHAVSGDVHGAVYILRIRGREY